MAVAEQIESDEVRWTMDDTTIVRKVLDTPQQTTIADPMDQPVFVDGRMFFNVHANVESLPQGKHLKKVTIFSNVKKGGTWEIISDEGTAVGGRGSAPSPLMFFGAGIALCMMSHIEMLSKQRQLTVKARLEQKFAFSTSMNLKGAQKEMLDGGADFIEMNVILESDADPDDLSALMQDCKKACMAFQSITTAVSGTLRVTVDSKPLADV